jgi:hypothetical protein
MTETYSEKPSAGDFRTSSPLRFTDRSGDFVDAVRKLNFRKMDAATGETGELDESSDGDDPNYDDDFDDYTPMY